MSAASLSRRRFLGLSLGAAATFTPFGALLARAAAPPAVYHLPFPGGVVWRVGQGVKGGYSFARPPAEVTVLELAQIIVRLSGSSSPIQFRPLPVDDPKQRRPDITRARKLLAWQPEVALEDGLSRTLEYFRRVVPGT